MKLRYDHRSCNRNLSNCKCQPEKNIQGFNGIRTHVLCVGAAVLYQLSYEDPYGCHVCREQTNLSMTRNEVNLKCGNISLSACVSQKLAVDSVSECILNGNVIRGNLRIFIAIFSDKYRKYSLKNNILTKMCHETVDTEYSNPFKSPSNVSN